MLIFTKTLLRNTLLNFKTNCNNITKYQHFFKMKIYIKNVLIEIDILTYSTNNTRNIIMHECSKSALFIYDKYIYIYKKI